jgi:hypothetical protein
MTALVLGDFDAEGFWRGPDLCTLPAVADPQAGRIVAAMDELLFPMCGPGDLLITRGAIEPAQQAYLSEQGFRFRAATMPGAPHQHETVAEAILRCDPQWLGDALGVDHEVRPFAITPGIAALDGLRGLSFAGPPLEVVRRVNSKVYSTMLRDRLGLDNPGVVVEQSSDLERAGLRVMANAPAGRPLLIKDPFGVSGAGNLTVSSPATLRRIASHLARQEQRGKRTQLVLEPLLDKGRDFSCQLSIGRDGALSVLSLQEMVNDHRAYLGSRTAPEELVEVVAARGYFDVTTAVGRELHDAGYWGPACLDSMVLGEGVVFPIVEINARMSMGALNHLLDASLPAAARTGLLSYLSLSLTGALRQEQLLEVLAREDLLHRGEAPGGIMPLAAGPLSVNAAPGVAEGRHRARLYFKAIDDPRATAAEHVAHLRRVLTDLGGKLL